jgi:integrase
MSVRDGRGVVVGWCGQRIGCLRASRATRRRRSSRIRLTYRDRAIVLAMVLGGLRAGEVRSLRLADVDMGLGRVRVIGKGAVGRHVR